jgi:indole-3-glycerol phosphate synthase
VSSILDQILAVKRAEVAALAARGAHVAPARATPPRSLEAALRRPPLAPIRVLAEVKRASPSAGPIRAGADPVAIAREYADAGAAAISVLTDRQFFAGDLAFLAPCHDAVAVPILRKDFMIDALQIREAHAAGADAILLIVAALDQPTLRSLFRAAGDLALDALVEVHDLAEAHRALELGATLIGVNHRDLRTFSIDMSLTEQVARVVPPGTVLVAESGIRSAADVRRLGEAGAHAILVGEHLMRAPSPGAALRELLAPAGSS